MSRKIFLLFVVLLIVVVSVSAHDTTNVYVERLWAAPCEEGLLAVSMVIDNTTADHPIALVGAASPIAEAIALVDESCTGEPLERVVVPAGESVDSYALVIESDDEELSDAFSLILTFDMLDDDLNIDGDPVELVVGVPIVDEVPEATDILVMTPWVRPTIDEMAMEDHGDDDDMPMFPAAVYMTLLNRGEEAERLITASSPVAGITEIHETQMQDDVMRMGEIDGLDLPVDETVTLEPGGYHIMLLNLERELLAGQAIPLTLTFESGAETTIAVPVYDLMMMDHSEHDG